MTREGDGGTTFHPRSGRVSKASAEICALGEIDELDACVGLLVASLPLSCENMRPALIRIQHDLFKIGGLLAGAAEAGEAAAVEASLAVIDQLERTYGDEAGPLRHFLVPGGHPAACVAHLARAVCRRAERAVAGIREEGRPEAASTLAYLNRLSGCLFELARAVNLREKTPENRP